MMLYSCVDCIHKDFVLFSEEKGTCLVTLTLTWPGFTLYPLWSGNESPNGDRKPGTKLQHYLLYFMITANPVLLVL